MSQHIEIWETTLALELCLKISLRPNFRILRGTCIGGEMLPRKWIPLPYFISSVKAISPPWTPNLDLNAHCTSPITPPYKDVFIIFICFLKLTKLPISIQKHQTGRHYQIISISLIRLHAMQSPPQSLASDRESSSFQHTPRPLHWFTKRQSPFMNLIIPTKSVNTSTNLAAPVQTTPSEPSRHQEHMSLKRRMIRHNASQQLLFRPVSLLDPSLRQYTQHRSREILHCRSFPRSQQIPNWTTRVMNRKRHVTDD